MANSKAKQMTTRSAILRLAVEASLEAEETRNTVPGREMAQADSRTCPCCGSKLEGSVSRSGTMNWFCENRDCSHRRRDGRAFMQRGKPLPRTIGTEFLTVLLDKKQPMKGVTQPLYENFIIPENVVILDEIPLKPEADVAGFRGRM